MALQVLLQRVLFLFGIGFLIANLLVAVELIRFRLRKRSALLTWQGAKPQYYGFSLALGVMLGLLFVFKLFVQHRPIRTLLGESMMFVYYGYALPLSTRIARGFYRDGIWSDSGFLNWAQISAVSWKEEGTNITLVVISHFKNIAKKLEVPGNLYGQARRLLRDQVKAHAIHIGGTGLDLGSRDEADAV
ncbi:MAG: hypothetical protein ACXV5L_09840 [Thermoanaerobaculia bacterium]